MALDADAIIDRRRLKRRLTLWRLVAVAAVAAAVLAAVGRFGVNPFAPYVARLTVDGIIFDDSRRDELLTSLANDDRVKAVLVVVDSPGGTVTGGEILYARLREIAEHKPVVAVMGGTATSAGYMTAIAADRIFARAATITGSIGVILQTADVTELLGKIGIKPETFKSGPLKAQPNPMEKTTPEARKATQDLVAEMHAMFVDMVASRRALPREKVLELADGRVFSGRRAADLGLVDALGGETEARSWLAENREIPEDLPTKTVEVRRDREWLKDLAEGAVGKALFSERLRLDGLISVWHPSGW